MYQHEMQIRVRYAETDQMNIVYHGNYAQYFEVARAESIRHMGFTYNDMEKMGIVMPVVELTTKFLRPAHYDELLTIRTTLKELPPAHRIEFHYEVYNESGKLLTIGKVMLYFINAATREKSAMPEQLKLKLAPYFRDDEQSQDKPAATSE
jgi:acyl-CoA thioester hydrolase